MPFQQFLREGGMLHRVERDLVHPPLWIQKGVELLLRKGRELGYGKPGVDLQWFEGVCTNPTFL